MKVVFEMPVQAAQNLRTFMNRIDTKGPQEAMALVELAQNLELAIKRAEEEAQKPKTETSPPEEG